MPKYELTITTTAKQEKQWAQQLADEIWYDVKSEVCDESGVHWDDVDDTKGAKAALRQLKKAAKELIPGVIEAAIKELKSRNDLEEIVYENYVYSHYDVAGGEIAHKNAIATILSDANFLKLAEEHKDRVQNEQRARLLNLAEKLGATVTFPDEE